MQARGGCNCRFEKTIIRNATITFCVERSHLSTITSPNEVLMLIFWKAFVCRKWQRMHQNEWLFSVFEPLKSGFLMNSAPFLRFGVLVVKLRMFCMLLFYSLLGEL